MKFEKSTDGAPVDFEALLSIDHEGLVKEWVRAHERNMKASLEYD